MGQSTEATTGGSRSPGLGRGRRARHNARPAARGWLALFHAWLVRPGRRSALRSNASSRRPLGFPNVGRLAAGLPRTGEVCACSTEGTNGARLEPVPLLLGSQVKIRRRHLIDVSRERLDADEIEALRGVRRTIDVRTAFDGARWAANLYDAVVFLDMMLTADVVTERELEAYFAVHPRWRGVPQARLALSLARTGSRSPPETRLRLLWVVEAGLPMPLVNPPIFSRDGMLLGYPDLLDIEAGTVLEYDGDEHRDIRQHLDDNVREECFEEHGLLVCRVGGLDLWSRRRSTIDRLIRTRLRGMARDRSLDRWTLQPPSRWRS